MEDEIKMMANDKITSALRFIKPKPTDYVGSFSASNRKIYEIYKDYGENHYILKHAGKIAYDIFIRSTGAISLTKRRSSSNASRRSSSRRKSSSNHRNTRKRA
jgi:hypothetical protein